jgi:hypothetical protein
MFHSKRVWSVALVADVGELVEKLHNHGWCLCTGFRLEDYLFLNDATHEDSAQEIAVVKALGGERYHQIESWTVSWMERDSLNQHVRECLAGKLDNSDWVRPVTPTLQTPEQHGRCHLCA